MKKLFFPMIGLLILSGCTAAGKDYDILQQQVAQQNQTIQNLNQQLSGVQPAQADTWSQVQSLRQEVAALRGQLDTMTYALNQIGGATGLADGLSRHERALRLIETQLALDLQLNQPADGSPMPGQPAPGMGSAGGQLPGTSPVTTAPGMGSTAITPATPVTPAVTTPAAPGVKPADTAQALYDAGTKAFNERRYQQALNSFTDFTKTYPDNNLTSNAWFWQGECQYQLKNFGAAALAYEQVISKYPNSNKAPASYLKQGMSFISLDKKDAAKERLNQLMTKYPKAPEAIRAKQVLATI